MTVTKSDFERTIRAIRGRPEEERTGSWFNLIRYGGRRFLQESVVEEDDPRGVLNKRCL